jgi:hypothetical protein
LRTSLWLKSGDLKSLRTISVYLARSEATVYDRQDHRARHLERDFGGLAFPDHPLEHHYPIACVQDALGLEAPLREGVAKHRGVARETLPPAEDVPALGIVCREAGLVPLVEIVRKEPVEGRLVIGRVRARQVGQRRLPATY